MRKIWLKLKHRISMWLWRGNEWTGLIDEIDRVTEEISSGKVDKGIIPMKFMYLKNKSFDLVIKPR